MLLLGAAAHEALYALLVVDTYRAASLRAAALATRTSTTSVRNARTYLVARGWATERTDGRLSWSPDGWRSAVDTFVRGYLAVVRPRLLVGTFETEHATLAELEAAIVAELRDRSDWAFGGGSAAKLLVGDYHGPRVTLHVDASPALIAKLAARPSPRGRLTILRPPAGGVGLRARELHVANEILISAELQWDGAGRALDAARRVLQL